MPFDPTHIVFAEEAARQASPRLLLPELLQGAIAPDAAGFRRFLPAARTHLAIGRMARALEAAALVKDVETEAFTLGYLSHVWLDRFVSRWLPRHPVSLGEGRLPPRSFHELIARGDVQRGLEAWRALSSRVSPVPHSMGRFVDRLALARYCESAERRLAAVPPLDDDVRAAAIFASEKMRSDALKEFLPWVALQGL
jgi:hypothetical protein